MASLASSISKRLDRLRPRLESMCQEAGVPGLAVGVVHHQTLIHDAYLGCRDVENGLPVNRDTIFYVASLTKSMTAAALGILVDRGLLAWTTPVHDILPEMSRGTDIFAAKLTVLDVLSHTTGKAWADALYLESHNEILLPKEQALPIFDYLPQVEPVRSKYMYNNHAYNVAGLVIEKLSGLDWGDFISKELFTPLGMTRSYTYHPDDENVAVPYNILDDRTPSRLPFCNASSKTMMFAGQSVRTSMSDYLRYCQAYLESLEALAPRVQAKTEAPGSMINYVSKKLAVLMGYHESPQNVMDDVPPVNEVAPASEESPLREIGTIVRPRVSRPVDSLLEQTYALGWNRTQLPGSLDFGWNSQFLSSFPLLGSDYPGKLAIWHGGNMPGTTSAVCLLPESGTAVVVFQNSLGLCDVADWACQMIIDTIFLGKPAQDYLSLTKKSLKAGISRMEVVEEELRRERITGTSPSPLPIYPGRFVNRIGNWFIDIKLLDGQLHLEFLGKTSERFALRHYHYHTFVWNLSYNETVKIGQYIRSYEYYRIEFELNKEGEVDQLRWKHDKTVPEGEVFIKKARGTQRSA